MVLPHYHFSGASIRSGERAITLPHAQALLEEFLRDALKQARASTGAGDLLFHRDLLSAAELHAAIRQFEIDQTIHMGRAA